MWNINLMLLFFPSYILPQIVNAWNTFIYILPKINTQKRPFLWLIHTTVTKCELNISFTRFCYGENREWVSILGAMIKANPTQNGKLLLNWCLYLPYIMDDYLSFIVYNCYGIRKNFKNILPSLLLHQNIN